MGSIWVKEFTGGLDARRLPETTPGGVLIVGQDGHITRGGEFETRAAFVPVYTLPAGATKGLARTNSGLVVFGTDASVALPSGLTYQQIAHPSGLALDKVPSFDLYSGKIYAVGQYIDGSIYHFYNGTIVSDWYDGRARASFEVTGGAGTSTLTNLTVNGVAILTGTITWATDNATTAAAIASAINSYSSTPEYTATSVGPRVNIIAAAGTGATPNGYAVAMTLANGFTVSPSSGITLSGGSASSTTWTPGTVVFTFGTKVYALSGSNLHGSGVAQPTKWTTDATGAFFIDMSSQSSGAEQLVAVAPYQGMLAVFSAANIQIEYVDPDPTLNKLSQVLSNTGTVSGRSVTQFGDSDLFYLADSGIRSVRARDASNAAATTDLGVPIDDLVAPHLASLTEAQRANVIGLVEPRGGRFWMIVDDTIYVLSYFPGAKVSAWTTYKPGFSIEYAVVFNRKVYLRSGDTIYVYGGEGSALTYDDTVSAVARLPYLDANKPWAQKQWTGYDAALSGQWEVRAFMEPTNYDASDKLGVIVETTFSRDRIPSDGRSTHISLQFKSSGGYAKLGSVVIHYAADSDDDD